jgi:cell division protein FtsB
MENRQDEVSAEYHKPNYREWARVPYWSAEECLFLTFGKNPRAIVMVEKDIAGTSDFARHRDVVHQQILAAQRNKELPERVRPIEFLAWTREHKIDLPDELEKAISANETDIAQLQDQYEKLRRENQELRYEVDRLKDSNPPQPKEPSTNPEPSTKERTSLDKLILGMAMAKYKWDPNADRHPAAGKIAKDLGLLELDGVRLDLDLDEGTVLRYLRKAKKVLP